MLNKGGRPKKLLQDQLKPMCITVPDDLRERFDCLCDLYGMDRSKMFRSLLKVWLTKFSELLPVVED
jgi:metal-responsive CopG/Arc/MetJ family transcriptional regulator